MTKPQNISSLHAVWRPGDVVLDSEGELWARTDNPTWPWDYPGESGTRRQGGGANWPEGGMGELAPVRPLTLLVRDGHAVGGQQMSEGPPGTE